MPLSDATLQLLVPPDELRAPITDPFQVAVADLVSAYSTERDAGSSVIFGVPFDTTTLGRSGSREGPRAIRAALAGALGYNADIGVDLAGTPIVSDAGDVDVLHTDVAATWDRVTAVARELGGDASPLIVIGGDHALTFPVLRGLAADRPAGIGVVNLDAHYDLRPSYHGQPASGVPFRYALERLDGAVRAQCCTHVGITGWANSRHAADYADSVGLRAFSGMDVRKGSLEAIAGEALARGTADTAGVWISLDIDVVDGAFAPGTGSPTVGGIDSRELLQLIWLLAQEPRVIGLDVVEVAPAYDSNGITAKLAATAILTFLAARQGAGNGGPPSGGFAAAAAEDGAPA